jgi:hypothetical protein
MNRQSPATLASWILIGPFSLSNASIDSIKTRCDPHLVRIVFNVPARIL